MILFNEYTKFLSFYHSNQKKAFIDMLDNGLYINDICVVNKKGQTNTLLNLVAFDSNNYAHKYEWIDLLLEKGFKVNLLDEDNGSTLIYAFDYHEQEVFNYLIKKGALIDFKELISIYDDVDDDLRLSWFYPWYDKINWLGIDRVIEQEVKEGWENLKLKDKLEKDLIEKEKKHIKV